MELGAGWGGTWVLKERPKTPVAYIESITCGDGTPFTIFEKLWSMKNTTALSPWLTFKVMAKIP
jgi:hypothetical protein